MVSNNICSPAKNVWVCSCYFFLGYTTVLYSKLTAKQSQTHNGRSLLAVVEVVNFGRSSPEQFISSPNCIIKFLFQQLILGLHNFNFCSTDEKNQQNYCKMFCIIQLFPVSDLISGVPQSLTSRKVFIYKKKIYKISMFID